MRPYIGITDFTSPDQVQRMREVFVSHLPAGSNRILHVGVMMSYKTLYDIPSRWSHVFPAKETIADIFSSNKVYNCLHYADYDGHPDLAISLDVAASFGGPHLHALQLDMIWPDPRMVEEFVYFCDGRYEIILQIGENALKQVGHDPWAVVGKLRDYHGIISRVLLDRSMGRGLGMDATDLLPFARAIRENILPGFGIGAAGGLGPGTVHLAAPLAGAIPDLSIDAQSRLRPSGNALDPIDWNMAEAYLIEALELFGA